MTPLVASLVVAGSGIIVGLAVAAIGAIRLGKLALALKARTDGYKTLPVATYVFAAQGKVSRASRRIEGIPALAYRMNAALAMLSDSRSRAVAIATSPTAIWRLGELVVTGK